MRIRYLLVAMVLATRLWAAPQIVAFTNGYLNATNLTPNSTAVVEWASMAAGPWSTQAAVAVDANGAITVPVPFFYRVLDNPGVGGTTTTTSTSTTTSIAVVTTTSSSSTTAGASKVLAFVGINADGGDDCAIVALTALPADSTLYLTDNEWNGQPIGGGGSFDAGEAVFTWNTGLSVINAGTVVAFTNVSSATTRGVTVGTLSGPSTGLSSAEEAVFIFEGTSPTNPTAIFAAIANNGTNSFGSLAGTGLDTNTTAVVITGSEDIGAYTGPRTGQSGSGYLPLIANVTTNWITEDGTGDQNTNGIPPDVPFDLTPFTP